MEEKWTGLKYKGKNLSNLFEVSNMGNIKRINKKHLLKQHTNQKGYKTISISLGSRENTMLLRMHRAIIESFCDINEETPIVHHIDFNKGNNNLDNLKWCTKKDNFFYSRDKILSNKLRGTDVKTAKLNYESVGFIRANYIPFDKTFGCRALSRKFGVNHHLVLKVINNEKWKESYDIS
jgi:hypothetical protein